MLCYNVAISLGFADVDLAVVCPLGVDIFDRRRLFDDFWFRCMSTGKLVDVGRGKFAGWHAGLEQNFELSVCSSSTKSAPNVWHSAEIKGKRTPSSRDT